MNWRAPKTGTGSTVPVSLLLAAWLTSAPAFAQSPHQQHPPRSSEEFAHVLNDPARDAWQKPHEVLDALALRPDETIVDLGAGTGYFSRRFARHAGTVLAVDIDAKLLARAAQEAPPNHRTVLAAPDDPKLEPASAHTIFICDVWHHIAARSAYLARLSAALRPGGRIAVIDFHKRRNPVGPPPTMLISRDDMIAEFAAAGFRVIREFGFLPHQYFLVFARQ